MYHPPALDGQLVSLPTSTVPIDGIWYRTSVQPPRATAMLLHGNGGNFYSGPVRFLPAHLLSRRIECFSYNRRGHETLTTRTRMPEGNAYQTAAQAIEDNEVARAHVAEGGDPTPVVIGHSNGGLYAARHVADTRAHGHSSCSRPTSADPRCCAGARSWVFSPRTAARSCRPRRTASSTAADRRPCS